MCLGVGACAREFPESGPTSADTSNRSDNVRTTRTKPLVIAVLALLGAVSMPGTADAQATIAYDATRPELEQKLDSLEAMIPGDPDAKTGGDEGRLLREAMRIQDRLENGDMQPGDMVRVQVGTDSILSGTYRVTEGRSIEVPTVGEIEVGGLLYSEVGERVRRSLGSVVRTPRIEVQPLVRVAVLGQVASPGYYDLSPTATISDALMAAGGPTQNAELQKTRLRKPEQGDDEGSTVRNLTGRSLADLGVARGDEVFVPSSAGGLTLGTITTILGVATSVALVITNL